jgi:signal peptidase II
MPASSSRRLVITIACLAIAGLIATLDQVIKNQIVADFKMYEVRPFLGDLVKLTYVLNDSAAFSFGFGLTGIFTLISSIATLLVIWFITVKSKSTMWSIIAAVLLGGVLGNLIDRLFRSPGAGLGKVVDYIQVPFNFPIFNIADIAIVSMAILGALLVMLGYDIGKPGKAKDD